MEEIGHKDVSDVPGLSISVVSGWLYTETVKFTHRTDDRHAEVIGSRSIPQDISTDLLVCCIGLYDKMLESPCRPDWQQLF
jgi:hypothetical protein